MYVVAPRTKRPNLPLLQTNDVVLVHDHTYVSYRYLISKKGKCTHRLAFPCCANGCPHRSAHSNSQCSAAMKLKVEDWPVNYDFKIERIDDEYVQIIKSWMEEYKRRVFTYRPCLVEGKTLLRLGEHELPENEIPVNLPDYEPDLPMGLVDGPIPYDPRLVAEYALAVIYRRGSYSSFLPLPANFERVSSSEYVQRCRPQLGQTHLTRLPYGYSESDLVNAGTWAESKYEVGHDGLTIPIGEWRAYAGDKEYTDPETYVRDWIREKAQRIERDRYKKDEFCKKREAFIRTIWVNKKFANAYGDIKREYLDERREQKRQRAIRDFGAEYADALLSLPILCFGPDADEEDQEEDDRSVYDSEEEEEEAHKLKKPRTVRDGMDILISNLKSRSMHKDAIHEKIQ
jgi:hypothetical protein